MEKQKDSTMSIAMIYATFSELLQVYQHIYSKFDMYILQGSSMLIEHQFVLPEILIHKLAR